MSNIDRILNGDRAALVEEIATIATWARNLSAQEWHNINHDSNGGLKGVIDRILDTVAHVQDDAMFNRRMSFGQAIEAAKQGKRIARNGWNGKNQYVELAYCISYKNNAAKVVNVNHCNIGNKALAFVGTSGVQIGWLASQADMLADDWYIVEE